jgi:hypothetical protein
VTVKNSQSRWVLTEQQQQQKADSYKFTIQPTTNKQKLIHYYHPHLLPSQPNKMAEITP